MKHLSLLTLSCVLTGAAFAQTGRGVSYGPPVDNGNGPAPESGFPPEAVATHSGPGADFLQVSTTTRTAGLANPPQNCPFTLDIPALPAGAVVIETLISWTYLADATDPTDTITVNNIQVVGAQLGFGTPDLCWGKTFGVTYLAAGATSIVNIGGSNTIDGACDGPGAGDPSALGEGITVIVIYEVPNDPARTVDVFTGYTSSQSSTPAGAATATLELTCPYNGGPTHFFCNADDGQFAGDTFFINNVNVGGMIAGTFSATDAWVGLAGPAPDSNLYDAADGDSSAWMTAGDTSLLMSTVGGGDCVAHSLAAISYEPDSNCSACSILRFCNPFTGSLNNVATIGTDACSLTGQVVLTMFDAPAGETAYLVIGEAQSLIVNPPGALGDLCIVGSPVFGRYAKDLGVIASDGSFPTDISNSVTGGPNFGIPLQGGNIMSGDTWYFQFWHRNPTGNTGLSEAVCITFQ